MSQARTASLIVLVIGAGLLAVSVFADSLGVGDNPGFGPQQTKGTVAGGVILLAGLWLIAREKKPGPPPA